MNRRYVAFLVDGSSRFIGSRGLKLYAFVADVTGHSKIAVISHGRAFPRGVGGVENCRTKKCDLSARLRT